MAKILIIGTGGREYALARAFAAHGHETIMSGLADIDALIDLARAEGVDLTTAGSETLLVAGIADRFAAAGLRFFGPGAAAARLEGSKAYAKDFMARYGVKTARYEVHTDYQAALGALANFPLPVVIKADGLAAGKGVLICETMAAAEAGLRELMLAGAFGGAGTTVVIEQFLRGYEVSILSLANEEIIVPLVAAKDHKRIGAGDTGPNTGGMGTFAPHPGYTPEVAAAFERDILAPTAAGIKAEGLEFAGVIFFGLMVCADGVYLLEYNMRPGDPETQVVLPLVAGDFYELMVATLERRLTRAAVTIRPGSQMCVVLASGGYPGSYQTGVEVTGLDQVDYLPAGLRIDADGRAWTAGGRVVNILAHGETLAEARERAYAQVARVDFEGKTWRDDIGANPLGGPEAGYVPAERPLGEECGVVGIFGSDQAANLAYYGLHALQHRGQEGCGIAVGDGTTIRVKKAKGLLSQVFEQRSNLEKLAGSIGIGHVRYSTCGANWSANVQPFVCHLHDHNFATAHNGNMINARSLKIELERLGSIFTSTSDSELLMHLIQRQGGTDFEQRLRGALARLEGAFSFVVMSDDALYAAVDPNGCRPLALGVLPADGGYMVASETCALDIVGARFERTIHGGELVRIDADGVHVERYTKPQPQTAIAMEFIYFARPDSDILGRNVHAVRKSCGVRLAAESPADADIVIGVPNSSLSAASGYAEAIGLPYEMGLIKNQYVSRTFIQPTQELRERGVRMKLSAVRSIVAGKRVVLVDDSIVRGTTSRRIVKLLRDAGAAQVHLRIASPPFMFPSFYGIDTQDSRELIAANMTIPQMSEHLGADSLAFLSIQGLVTAVALNTEPADAMGELVRNPNAEDALAESVYASSGLCLDCFTGHYPAGLGDFTEHVRSQLTPIQRRFLEHHPAATDNALNIINA